MTNYVPPQAGPWRQIAPEQAGFSPDGVQAAIDFAIAHESSMNRDIGQALEGGHFSEPLPEGAIIGPTRPRGDPAGMILRHGQVVADWGPIDAADMTFSVTKSYLAICAGLAFDDGLIGDLDDPVAASVGDAAFAGPHNGAITWRHLLQQTSEWEGTLWGKADLIDRHRQLGLAPNTPSLKGTHRDLAAPGGFWEYNDVRVNVLAYALMLAFRRPLPEVLRERVMQPIGASDRWEWHGYETSWVDIDGRRMQSVSGGAHWGGGLFIPSTDHARIGLLMTRGGLWGQTRVLSERWIDECLKPCALNPSYGLLWWLNKDRSHCKTAPETSSFALGVGRNIIWIDPALDLVAVLRWLDRDALDGFVDAVMTAMKG